MSETQSGAPAMNGGGSGAGPSAPLQGDENVSTARRVINTIGVDNLSLIGALILIIAIIVFMQPCEPERDYIKRVIGVPGDTVRVTAAGAVFVNGAQLVEPYINPLYAATKPHPPTRVKPGHYFVMGDHRNLSSDSRDWGQASVDLIKGRAFIVLLSTKPPGGGIRPSEQVTLKSLGVKLYKLVFHSRWDRALRPIR